ncbi:GIY-YIG nuclease family protein [Vagococcus carniphilus]|uniref:GIY-YIG nuclease family protein n=1 Tax=Vagococcus carniphilus TaxID=218144 RepID=UPI003B5B312E
MNVTDILESFLFNKDLIRIVLLILAISFLKLIIQLIQAKKINSKINDLANNSIELTPEEFMLIRNKRLYDEKARHANIKNFPGVYILHNKTKDLYYVGQSIKVLDRIGNHFKGRGNGDVYADFKYGDQFTIRTIALENSDFSNLNDLERYAIRFFGAYEKGYNRNKGNKSK